MNQSKINVIADTNILSYIFKGGPVAAEYAQLLSGCNVRTAFATSAELQYWAEKNRWGPRRRQALHLFLSRFPEMPYHKQMAASCAQLMAECEHAGRRMEWADAWVATTALWYDLPLVTQDAAFRHVPGLQVISAGFGSEADLSKYDVLAMRPGGGRIPCSL